MGGVLFIDEACSLYRASDSKDYGQEVVDILLQVMENDRDKLVVILAGYKDRMDEFFGSNPGMSSRIAHHLDFAAFELEELVHIGRRMMNQSNYYLSAEAEEAFSEYLSHQMGQPRFANARSVRNELDRARLRHAPSRDRTGPRPEPGRPDAPRARGRRHPCVTAGPLPRRAAGPPGRADRPRAIRSPTPTSIQPRP